MDVKKFRKLLREEHLSYVQASPDPKLEKTTVKYNGTNFTLYNESGPEIIIKNNKGNIIGKPAILVSFVEQMSEQEAKEWIERF